ncbi:MAG TPA: hypothetical protein VHH73_01450 [Verrucomicrobiae bacterium]|nr:hypothetical protein [Verrucomicrobiae bacterium]
MDSNSIESAESLVEDWDIHNNPAALTVFLQVVIDYSRRELRKEGVDLFTLASYDEIQQISLQAVRQYPLLRNDKMFVVLDWKIQRMAHRWLNEQTFVTPPARRPTQPRAQLGWPGPA